MNLGSRGVSFVEIFILYELWAGERLDLEKAVHRYRSPGREISVSAVPFGPGTDIWRVLCLVELEGFSLDIGANHCRLGILVGRSVGMVSRLGLVRLLLGIS